MPLIPEPAWPDEQTIPTQFLCRTKRLGAGFSVRFVGKRETNDISDDFRLARRTGANSRQMIPWFSQGSSGWELVVEEI